MLEDLSSRQISEWIEYANLEPFGSMFDLLLCNRLVATILNVLRGKDAKVVSEQDFMPDYKKMLVQGQNEQIGTLKALFGAKMKLKSREGGVLDD